MWRTEPWQTQPSAITVTLSFSFNPLGIVAARSEICHKCIITTVCVEKPLPSILFLDTPLLPPVSYELFPAFPRPGVSHRTKFPERPYVHKNKGSYAPKTVV